MVERKETPTKGTSRVERPRRSSTGGFRDILTVEGKDPEYMYRWVLDTNEGGARIWRLQEIGYEFAKAEGHRIGENAVFASKQNGSIIRRPADKDGNYLYLMRIRKEWYDEDRENIEKEIKAKEDEMYRRRNEKEDDGQYGSIEMSTGFSRSN